MTAITRLNAMCEHAATRGNGTLDFTVQLLAEDPDGHAHTVIDDRGFSLFAQPPGRDPWIGLTASSLCADVKATLLPDNSPEALDWGLLVSRLVDRGVRTTPDALRNVPYDVTLSAAIREHL